MNPPLIFTEAFRYAVDPPDLRSEKDTWDFALDQRAFGPRRLLVVTARRDGRVLGLAHCGRTDPPEIGLAACLDSLDDGAEAAVAYCDEAVSEDPAPDLGDRFGAARRAAAQYGVYLVDWIMCDDTVFRSLRMLLEPDTERWDVATAGCRRSDADVTATVPLVERVQLPSLARWAAPWRRATRPRRFGRSAGRRDPRVPRTGR